ncbi:3-deoxy-manno-octulosonate cytidylyltransferase [Novosphingobium flavum]|uniref:3-deoxy-manno-octulosonate cytidylyltransferase n=1 Tax=Novosphingobium aerophilum TaxID=2839843 RepID=UPI001639BE54|nr:3-deoxy-manno-octulosonate cytidylyltransferase [Novosphingobium aerophilum]MBC2661972.1 3-deoxy-manno-octulosonate cytidylyltransferase [Novosphingobium aerophilum]
MATDFAIIIPARYASQRYPGKPLAELRGATGEPRSLIRRSWDAAVSITAPDRVWVATDDARIAGHVADFGGQVVLTPETCRNGTERCAAALAVLGDVAPIIVNLQGDAPLTPDFVVADLVAGLAADSGAVMTTPAVQCSSTLYRHLITDQAQGRVGGTTVVFGADRRALYFSKRVVPHVPETWVEGHAHVHLHLGVYAYRPSALRAYAAMEPTALELLEGLEQLRFLESGEIIRVVPFAPIDWDCIELNNPEDVPSIEAVLRQRKIP